MRLTWGKVALAGADIVLLSTAYVSAFWLRLGWEESRHYASAIAQTLPVFLVVSILVHLHQGLFNAILRYASLDTAVVVLKSVLLAVLASCLITFLLFRLDGLPRSVFVIYTMAALLLVGGSRLVVRFFLMQQRALALRRDGRKDGRRVLLYEVGDTAELALRGLANLASGLDYVARGIIDPSPTQSGRSLHGVRILGGLERLRATLAAEPIDEIWVCKPGIAGEELRAVYDAARSSSAKIKLLPRLEHALLGADLRRFQEPDIAHLLRRPPRSLDRQRMQGWIEGRRVLITGAGGSIGSELAAQVARLHPKALALCDASECNLFTIHEKLKPIDGTFLQRPYLVDVRDGEAVERMFAEARPEVVFHAAAYKHVPLVELNPCEGIETNVLGLYQVASAAVENDCRDFVFISTDKAVRPTSIMGATKRAGEVIVQVLNKLGATRFTAVRFGNVLGSSGSVVPIFQEQIRRGGPVTVTHREMTRYFMLVSEAVELVIQAGSIGKGGEVFILDMGKPVCIYDMARDLIRLMGKEVDRDIRIEVTQPRPGEKIHEELMLDPNDSKTSFHDIWIDGEPAPALDQVELRRRLSAMLEAAAAGDSLQALQALKKLVIGFTPTYSETAELLRLSQAAQAPRRTADAGARGDEGTRRGDVRVIRKRQRLGEPEPSLQ